ncbi:hypothetical protein M408DRAFT_7537 [Serendipita vermifera MAFF 305830]|uniref:Tyrosine specific protein phosphatases domain-containing protein n=1 Tax=Serendipita vermifera MAFF 305830 TaxID=933852 RepID=A0A0C2XN69_SERVB|nr:hypothetical protein M408DRAFT_7537 [Serendipita vermifera MAFF 305830]
MATVFGERQELLTPQQMMQVASMDRAEPETNPIVLRVAAQLSWLASQHHISEYNQLKFGPKGAAASYIPLSILLPAHVKELRVYQQYNVQKQAWWLSPKPRLHAMVLKGTLPRNDDTQENTGELQDALSLAMDSPLPPLPVHLRQLSTDQTTAAAKTSQSHPINMSPMVPFELLFRLHGFLQGSLDPSQPTYLHLPYELTLDALTAPNQSTPPDSSIPAVYENSQPNGTIPGPTTLSAIPASMIQAEVMEDAPTPPPAAHTSPKLRIDATMVPLPPSPEAQRQPQLPLPDASIASSSAEMPSYFTQPLSSTICSDIQEATNSILDIPVVHRRTPSSQNGKALSLGANGVQPAQNGIKATSSGDQDFKTFLKRKSLPVGPGPTLPPAKLGNLLLSSCPGKKVRLQGPVKGRGTICRDLGRDLQRIKDSGVGCIVCCLDDSELHFLGAPWEEYSREASQLGIDILRLPTPEGFAPLDPAVLNSHIEQLITQYTLHGVSILVHCRGGVGRAGLVACCWMLKMGLCGWIRQIDSPPPDHPYHSFLSLSMLDVSPDSQNGDADPLASIGQTNGTPSPHSNGSVYGNGVNGNTHVKETHYRTRSNAQHHIPGLVRLDTMDLVERVIRVVRRRRSVKAIETFEQVYFLVQFVEYLRGAPPPMATA